MLQYPVWPLDVVQAFPLRTEYWHWFPEHNVAPDEVSTHWLSQPAGTVGQSASSKHCSQESGSSNVRQTGIAEFLPPAVCWAAA